MFISIFLAKVLGLYLLIVGLAMLLGRERMTRMAQSYAANEGLVFFSSIFILILGLLLVVSHNYWIMGWPVIITIIAWMTLLKGILYLFRPQVIVKITSHYFDPKVYFTSTVITLVLGLILVFFGFSV